ncbi:MAG TPA: hypothetical protein VF405_12555 [Gammaproteobacteria bacterium]
MLSIARFGLAFAVGIATFYFAFWVAFSLVSFLPGQSVLAAIVSTVAAVWAARYTWRRSGGFIYGLARRGRTADA